MTPNEVTYTYLNNGQQALLGMSPYSSLYGRRCRMPVLNWAHRSVDKHTTHKVDHTIYSAIEE